MCPLEEILLHLLICAQNQPVIKLSSAVGLYKVSFIVGKSLLHICFTVTTTCFLPVVSKNPKGSLLLVSA